MTLDACLLVGLGGAVGGASRFMVSDAVGHWWGTRFPWGTLVVNVTGALIIGMVVGLARVYAGAFGSPQIHDLIITGLLGGYTTVSSFCLQTINLVLDQQTGLAFLNVIASTTLCLAAVAIGYFGGSWVASYGA
ncbi:fluoride efflux transporter CrcB [Rhodopseudomonas sp. NSM]|uniref:fluoride efflux transporter CrcB n=1 Tax=Rhodopseudomonas sp. NSM TaxID=3457630 RepID=UPI0040367934